MTSASSEKGKALERSVCAIERALLTASPTLAEKTFVIECRKILTVAGVHHEVDIWVGIDLGNAYETTFIFECKNWAESVGKNELIVFSEKVRAAAAARGFFVAAQYTADAVAQAELDPRVTLLRVADMSRDDLPIPFNFHSIANTVVHVDASLEGVAERDSGALASDQPVETIDGVSTLGAFISALANSLTVEDSRTFPSGTLPAGTYSREASQTYHFADGQLSIDGTPILSLQLHVEYQIELARPRVVSRFDVASRGRTHELEPVSLPGGATVTFTLTEH